MRTQFHTSNLTDAAPSRGFDSFADGGAAITDDERVRMWELSLEEKERQLKLKEARIARLEQRAAEVRPGFSPSVSFRVLYVFVHDATPAFAPMRICSRSPVLFEDVRALLYVWCGPMAWGWLRWKTPIFYAGELSGDRKAVLMQRPLGSLEGLIWSHDVGGSLPPWPMTQWLIRMGVILGFKVYDSVHKGVWVHLYAMRFFPSVEFGTLPVSQAIYMMGHSLRSHGRSGYLCCASTRTFSIPVKLYTLHFSVLVLTQTLSVSANTIEPVNS